MPNGFCLSREPPWLWADISRDYKEFTVSKDDGEVLAMKIRLFATSLQ